MSDGTVLNDTKKLLGLEADYDVFDTDILIHINSVFSTLHQLGLGPELGFDVSADTTWDVFINDEAPQNAVKTYVYLRVRLLFDPPTTSFTQESLKEQIKELEWRLNTMREYRDWRPIEEIPVGGITVDGGEV